VTPTDPIAIADWTPLWSKSFEAKARALREALGDLASRIDHIGSTAIDGMPAKPIIDIQISVADLEPIQRLSEPMARAGYVWRASNPELTKRYFRERPGQDRTHIHVRRLGSWHEQWALLFRDYMRAHPAEHAGYAALKYRLAEAHAFEREAYTDGKADYFWAIIRRADHWARYAGWRPGRSDA
jgi:GrpB-like predicted nucleotidyltransferase (UPF0157 family)